MTQSKPRKIVEISFDPESEDQFPNLVQWFCNHNQSRTSRKHKPKNDNSSPTSSQGDSIISAVTRAEFETLSHSISQMVKDEVQSTISTGTDQTMITLFRDEMAANRDEMAANWLEAKTQFELIQQQMTTFQTIITSLMPQLATTPTNPSTTNNDTPPTNNLKQPPTYTLDTSDTPMNQHDETHAPQSPPPIKKVHIADQTMHDEISHKAPASSGHTSPPKRPRGGLPGTRTTPYLTTLHPTPRTSARSANRVPIPQNKPSTTIGKKADGGKS
jgi:hypothetical protein